MPAAKLSGIHKSLANYECQNLSLSEPLNFKCILDSGREYFYSIEVGIREQGMTLSMNF